MELFSQKVERSKLVAGDHIYAWRNMVYSHHGIFIGEGKVIHFVNTGGGDGGLARKRFSAPSSSSFGPGDGRTKKKVKCPTTSYCGLEKVVGSGVRLSCIDCFIKEEKLCRFKYGASRDFLYAKMIGGTCTTAESDPPEDVIHRATYLHENGYGMYDLMNNNCEDFALYCKTGLWSTDGSYQGRSSQANAVRSSGRRGDDEKGPVEFVLRMVTAVPRSLAKREKKDLGVRDDVVKVPVEELSSFVLKLNEAKPNQAFSRNF